MLPTLSIRSHLTTRSGRQTPQNRDSECGSARRLCAKLFSPELGWEVSGVSLPESYRLTQALSGLNRYWDRLWWCRPHGLGHRENLMAARSEDQPALTPKRLMTSA